LRCAFDGAHRKGRDREGAIDVRFRNALTKMSHSHFDVQRETAGSEVIAMGEEAVASCIGPGGVDWRHLRKSRLLERAEVEARLGVDLQIPSAHGTCHPMTMAMEYPREADGCSKARRQVRCSCCSVSECGRGAAHLIGRVGTGRRYSLIFRLWSTGACCAT